MFFKMHFLSRDGLIISLEIKWEQLICIVRSQFSVNHWGVQDCGNLMTLLGARKLCF